MRTKVLLLFAIFALVLCKPKVYVIYTGGTIGMKKTSKGYEPAAGYLSSVVKALPNFHTDDMPDFTIVEYNPLLDSSNMSPADWLKVANDVYAHYNEYDGFVVIHGTDTMAYTASALSFLLQNTNKMIVVTGSQIPLVESVNDGVFNLAGAIKLAGTLSIPEVCVYFDHKLFRGNRVSKLSAWSLNGFDSGDFPPLATYGVTVAVESDHVLPKTKSPLTRPTAPSDDVVMLHLYPGITGATVRAMTKGAKGLVMLAFGTGNGPDANTDFLAALKEAHDAGCVIVDVTQCHQGIVNMGEYATGNAFLAVGAVSGYDLTPEAAYTKLSWLIGRGMSQKDIEWWMANDIRGEMSLPANDIHHEIVYVRDI
ncbi:Asparaginase/glutaminase [Carpediemonas membranifera]|uniref:asparaginase n=1 Tax=Carpediemonas membranifera TaxID=201153 RepID=A0A8J6E201_9EUKA|nr:Asparaginase/glutaminase [Carpediemonas membranifera]|eukprot:KAG9394088.1 Asparaginase/glutaminase [Carpediemonas membranifera]